MKPSLLLLSAILIVSAGAAGWYAGQGVRSPAVRQDAPAAPPQSVLNVNGETVVVVAPDAQRASHIEVSQLVATDGARRETGYATVLNLQSYFDLRNRLAAAQAELDSVTAQAGNSQAQAARSQVLFDDDRNISRKTLQEADSAMQADAAKWKASTVAVNALMATLRQQFGAALAAPAPELLAHLQSGTVVVLRVTLPDGWSGTAPSAVSVMLPDGQQAAAQRLSVAPTTDPGVPGVAWLYRLQQPLPAGLRTSVEVAVPGAAAASVRIPEQAILWYGGQAWAYVRTAPDRFTRRFVSASADDPAYLAPAGFRAGDVVVVQGAQLLLSEELKPQGIATVCKDPPECDD